MADLRTQIETLSARQDRVITTAQAMRCGAGGDWLEFRVRAGHWQRPHRGVLITHSGSPEWRTRARAALLYAGSGAALGGASAAFVYGITTKAPQVIDVVVPRHRYVRPSAGLHLRRMDRVLDKRSGLVVVQRGDAVLDLVAQESQVDDVVGRLCDAVRAGVSVLDIRLALGRRVRQPKRPLLAELVAEVDAGVESPLERRYNRDVERRHGLPRALPQERQVIAGSLIRADGIYAGLGVRRELDGELAHPGGRTDADTWRDNAVLIATGEITLRYRWRHVACMPCRTAQQVVAALRSRGWRGVPHPCVPACPVR